MIIGIDISQVVYNTGVSRYTKELVRNLLKIDKTNNYKLYAGTLRQLPELLKFISELKKEGLQFKSYIYPIPPKIAEKLWNRWRPFSIEMLIGKVDIFHCSDWTQPPAKAPKVTTLHDLTPLMYSKYHTPYVVSSFTRNLELLVKETKAIITVSKATKEDAANYGIERVKMRVVYSGVSTEFAKVSDADRERVRNKYKIRKPFILTVGTREPRKNIKRLIEAYQSLGGMEAQLLIAGKYGWGDDGGEGKEPNQNIRTLGYVPDFDLPALYSLALIFVYPSLYEGFGLPVLESMAAGCPVITSNISSLPEVAGEGALLVYPKDSKEIAQAISALLHNEKLRQSLIKKGREQAAKFSWENTAQATLKIYQQLYQNK